MGAVSPRSEDAPMIDARGRTTTGRNLTDPTAVAREARRLVSLERHYHCDACGSERSSWTRMSACPECGEAFVAAVIRRAAFA
jgi:hypothetical protein